MSKKQKITTVKNGPLVVENLDALHESVGQDVRTPACAVALCRCGKSGTKPYCDGTHGKIGFTDEKSPDHVPRKVDLYIGAGITIHDDRGICSHVGYCTDGLPSVFRMRKLPWIAPDEDTVERIIETIRKCPSGALSYSIDGVHYDHYSDTPRIKLAENGPYTVTGEIALNDKDTPISTEHYTLCRCGKSKNKPFCSGQHWYEKFVDDGKVKTEPKCRCSCTEPYDNKLSAIQNLAQTAHSTHKSMRTEKPFIGFESILFKNAQVATLPLEGDTPVSTKTVIGKSAKHPLVLDIPFYVSHMSFGAISREAKIALAQGSAAVNTAMCSGEGGMLQGSRKAAKHYIYELGTAPFSHDESAIKMADAVEIKMGQAAKPGLGGVLPAAKVTDEIARIRNIKPGEDGHTPARMDGVNNADDLRKKVDWVRSATGGKPVGIKFAAGHIEADIETALLASPDFITIDCRGGATGSAPVFMKDNVCVPAVYAIRRARRYLDSAGSDVTLCITGGFRDSSDIAKALALGADAVALATASLISIGCIQAKVCHTGKCPVGISTQDSALRRLFSIDKGAQGLKNFYSATRQELMDFARSNGKNDVHQLSMTDVMTTSDDVACYTDIPHV
jgi:methylamine---glutamate N-methyltransferase subunit C